MKRECTRCCIRKMPNCVYCDKLKQECDNCNSLMDWHCIKCEMRESESEQKKELNKIVAWLNGPHVGSDTVVWQETIRPIYDEIANAINAGAYKK